MREAMETRASSPRTEPRSAAGRRSGRRTIPVFIYIPQGRVAETEGIG
jgi:hypothetical protein